MLSFMKSDDNKNQDRISENITQPIFPGCEDTRPEDNCTNKSLMSYVYSNLEYPKQAQEAKIEGKALAEFFIDENGEIGSISILKDIGGGTSEEIRRVLLSMNSMPSKWIPGKKDGKFVSVRMALPVIFKLADSEITLVAYGNPKEKSWETVTDELKEDKLQSDVFFVVDQMPRFPGCEDLMNDASEEEVEECHQMKLLTYVYGHIKYPKIARKDGVSGMAAVQFTVNRKGKLEDIELVKKVHESIDKEVLRMISIMSEEITWIPGVHNGKNVDVKYTLPVRFKLEGDEGNVPPPPPPPPSVKNTPPPPPPPPGKGVKNIEKLTVSELEFTISPNPAQSQVKITTLNHLNGDTKITIHNDSGNQVKSQNVKSKDSVIDIQSLAPGNYVIMLENNGMKLVKKFVKM